MTKTLRERMRFAERVALAFMVADTPWPAPRRRGGVLFSCYDVDRGMKDEQGLRFSPLLEGLAQLLAPLRLDAMHLTHPWAVFAGHQVRGGALTLNRRFMRLRLRAKLPGGDPLALETAAYAALLDRLSPERIFSIQPPLALCIAARRAGIVLTELMHGTHISIDDRIFCAHMARPEDHLPQEILSFDDVTDATVRQLTQGRSIRTLRATAPWLLACRRRQSAAPALPGRRERRVLVTLQWGYDGEREALSGIVPDGVLHPALEDAIAGGRARGLHFLLRMHPIQVNAPGYAHHRRRIEKLAARHPHVEYTLATAWPLPLLLDEVSAHVTMSSSSVGDAAAAGVKSLALCPTLQAGRANHGLFRELEASGQLRFGRLAADDILDWLDTTTLPPPRDPRCDSEAFKREAAFYAGLLGAPAAITSPLETVQ